MTPIDPAQIANSVTSAIGLRDEARRDVTRACEEAGVSEHYAASVCWRRYERELGAASTGQLRSIARFIRESKKGGPR